jgi:hypothetical protein
MQSRTTRKAVPNRIEMQVGLIRSLLTPAAMLALLLLSASAALASQEEQTSSNRPGLAEIMEAGPSTIEMPHTNPQAAAGLPQRDLNRAQANELLTAVFGPIVSGPSDVLEELDVERFYADNVAVVASIDEATGEGSPVEQPALVESTVPLRVEDENGDKRKVDLDLEQSADALEPENPLVEVAIPTQLGDGLALPESGVEIELAGAPADRSPSTLGGGLATYPNVATDTSLAVTPTPTGVETFTVLQSPDAPTSQTFNLDMPEGVSLKATEDGGAIMRNGAGEPILGVYPPYAIDAKGEPVPVQLEVGADSFTLVAEPDETSVYPILVDPVYETFLWRQQGPSWSGTGMMDTWVATDTPYEFWTGTQGVCPGCPLTGARGLNLTSGIGWAPAMAQARWDYRVPRWNTDYNDPNVQARPTTYIKKATLWNLFFDATSGAARPLTTDPFFEMYIWDHYNGFVSIGRRLGTEGDLTDMNWQYHMENPNSNVNAKQVSVELVTTQSQWSQYRHVYVGSASIELTDNDNPALGSLGSPSQWFNGETTKTFPFTVSDPGLGVSAMVVDQAGSTPAHQVTSTKEGCIGTAMDPCPRTWKDSSTGFPKVTYNPSIMPQGENWIKVYARDAIGRESSKGEVRVKVDHTAPKVSLSGALTEQQRLARHTKYPLKYTATDGSGTAAAPLSAIGPSGTGEATPQRPHGMAADGNGNMWVVDKFNNRVLKFNENGEYLSQFGSAGTGPGQFMEARGVAITADGKIWVTDAATARVQQFSPTGQYLRQFGVKVPGPSASWGSKLFEPHDVATGPNGSLWISDPLANRVALFSETSTGVQWVRDAQGPIPGPVGLATDPLGYLYVASMSGDRVIAFSPEGAFQNQWGTTGTGNGQFRQPMDVAVSASGHVFVTDGLNNRVQEFLSSGQYLRQFGTAGSGGGQLNEPRGIVVEDNDVAFVADASNHRIARWSNATLDHQSGVVSTEIKVDGTLVEPKYAPGCASRNCSVSREWVLDPEEWGAGEHKVSLAATDGVGLSTTKELTFITDTTPPQLPAGGYFYTAPGGWLEQESYVYSTGASDPGGHGVTSLVLKVDGKVIGSKTGTCPTGGCARILLGSIDMAAYEGGSHAGELIATDAAGNTTRKGWTINVAPRGEIGATEALNTLEAVDSTASINTVGPGEEEPSIEGTTDGLGLEPSGGQFEGIGVEAPIYVPEEANDGVTILIPSGAAVRPPCATDPSEDNGEEEINGGAEEAKTINTTGCTPVAGNPEEPELEEIEITPAVVGPDVESPTLTKEQSGAVSSNIVNHVDLITRPLYDGALTFMAIRDRDGPETYSWQVDLEADQSLKLIDSRMAGVFYAEGHQAFTISAVDAHDAIGATIPTSLEVNGNILTLRVNHREPASGDFTYPVVAGAGWEGGFQTHLVEMPPPEEEEFDFEEVAPGVYDYSNAILGPPTASTSSVPAEAAHPSSIQPRARAYNFNKCYWRPTGPQASPYAPPKSVLREVAKGCHGSAYNPYDATYFVIDWAVSMSGVFHYKYGNWIWTNEPPNCRKWGRGRLPAIVNCYTAKPNPSSQKLNIMSRLRFAPGAYHLIWPMCIEFNGVLPVSPDDQRPYYGRHHWRTQHVFPDENCPWGHFPNPGGY